MKIQKLKLLVLTLVGAMVLAACGSGGNGVPDDGEISGLLLAAPGATLRNVTIYLCEAGTDCADPVDSRLVNTRGTQAEFRFTNVPAGNYDLLAVSPPQGTTPESRYVALALNVPSGSDFVTLDMELLPDNPTDGTASMSGTIYLPGSISSTDGEGAPELRAGASQVEPIVADGLIPAGELDLLQSNDLNSNMTPVAVPGEIMVTFEPDVIFSMSILGTMSVDGVQLQHVQGTGEGLHLYEAGADLNTAETLALAEQLRAQPGVRTAALNWLLHSFATPNDDLYPLQWHYDTVNMEAAWDIQRGSNSVTVAVVDSGSISHPDLTFSGGYNFITDPGRAGNSFGRGTNPVDPGDGSNYHGAHVAGTVGARTNNAQGVAGVNWNVRLVPIRVLGRNGIGATFDILDGTTWAAGGSVSGAPSNPHPAQVVNLSLGASLGQSCANVLGGDDSFFLELTRQHGTIFVVAAGNDNVNTSGVFPANCPGVITVGATGAGYSAAPYSNYGDEVHVFAPGGDLTASFSQGEQRYPYGVLSTVLQSNGQPGYAFFQGTSMATPHVAGIVALMLAQEPGLDHSTVLSRLQGSVSRSVTKNGYSRGLVDAAAALTTAGGGTPPPPDPPAPPVPGELVTYLLFTDLDGPDDQYASFTDAEAGGQPYLVYGLQPGRYRVEAWQDLDGSTNPPVFFEIHPDDPQDAHPVVTLRANQTTTGIDLYLDNAITD